jgi:hypothetical protein
MRADAYERLVKAREKSRPRSMLSLGVHACPSPSMHMGLAPGGKMRQQIHEDPFRLEDWDLEHSSRCFVHIANSMVWESVTGSRPPSPPPTAAAYTRAGLPWFDYYDEKAAALAGSKALSKLRSVREMGEKKGGSPLPENEGVVAERVVRLRAALAEDQVREGEF